MTPPPTRRHALAYVHENGVVHRDVKPGNVMLTSDNRCLLTDVGIAKLMGEATAGHRERLRHGHRRLPRAGAGPNGSPTEAALARLSVTPDIPADLDTGARARTRHALNAVAGSILSALALTSCGDQPSAGAAVPGLNRSLAKVDAAVADEKYRIACHALDQLTSRALEARRSELLSPDQADRILAAATRLEHELPLPLPAPATQPQDEDTSSDSEDSGDEHEEEDEDEDD